MPTEEFLPFALPDVGEQEIAAVSDAIRSGWLSSGPKVKEFETGFAEFLGGGVEAIAVNSATAGLHLALEACGIGPGDEVLVPTWTFTATAEVVRYLGAEPVLCDVDPESFNIDLEDAEQRVTARTRAIMPVHFAGRMVSPSKLENFGRKHGLFVIEDAAHALPASRDGVGVGMGNSAATVFSFYATKTITTGEGGMVVTGDARLAQRIRTMRLHGISRDAFDRYRSTTPSWRYEVVAPGYKYNLSDPAAAMGLVQLSKARAMRDRRAELAAIYDSALSDSSARTPIGAPAHGEHSWHLYVIRLGDHLRRDDFIDSMLAQGVGTSVHFIPLHLQPYWRDRAHLSPVDFPQATASFERVVSLPLFSSMTDGQAERVIRAVRTALTP